MSNYYAVEMSVYYISVSVRHQDITAKEVFGYDITYNSDITAMLESRYYSKGDGKDITLVVVSGYCNKGSIIILTISVL